MKTKTCILSALLLAGCGPDVAPLATSFNEGVSKLSIVRHTVHSEIEELQIRDEARSVVENALLGNEPVLTVSCNEIWNIRGDAGDLSGDPELLDEVREARQSLLEQLAQNCDYLPSEEEMVITIDTPYETIIENRQFLCGYTHEEIENFGQRTSAFRQHEPSMQEFLEAGINPDIVEEDLVEADAIFEMLNSYAAALESAAKAEDIDQLTTAASSLTQNIANLVAFAGPQGAAISGVLNAVGGAANQIFSLRLEKGRLQLIREVVDSSHDMIVDVSKLACHDLLTRVADATNDYYRYLTLRRDQFNELSRNRRSLPDLVLRETMFDVFLDLSSDIESYRVNRPGIAGGWFV